MTGCVFCDGIDFIRADGNVRCETCNRMYRNHPFSYHRSWDNQPYLRVLCDGTLVKL